MQNATIYKYPLPMDSRPVVELPRGAEVLCVQAQREDPYIWARVDPGQVLEPRPFVLVGTGHPLPDGTGHYVGTFQLMGGYNVFHLFEVA